MTTTVDIQYPRAVSRAEWLTARLALLEREKALTRERDRLNAARRELPMVRIDQDYVFTGPDGKVRLPDLFDGRRQLIVQHFMLTPGSAEGCPSCSYMADHVDGMTVHLAQRDITFVAISRAPK